MRVLPKGTEIPESPNAYMRFKVGDNRLRIVGEGIVGNELWVEGRPVRKSTTEAFTEDELAKADINKFNGKKKVPVYFWAFPVYNYETKKVEILEITQKNVMEGIQGYLDDEDYGEDATTYDLVVNRNEESERVKYSVRAKPPKALDKAVAVSVREAVKGIDLKKLFEGEDPFGGSSGSKAKFTDEDAEKVDQVSESEDEGIPF